MRIEIEVHTDKCGEEFLDMHHEIAEIFRCREKVVLELDDKQYVMPIEVFEGIFK